MKKEKEDLLSRIMVGLDLAYERMLEFKVYKKSTVVFSKNGKLEYHDPAKLLGELKK